MKLNGVPLLKHVIILTGILGGGTSPLVCISLRTRRPFRSFLLQRDCMLTVSGKTYYQDSLMRPPTGIENLDLKWLEYEDIDRIMYVMACADVRLVVCCDSHSEFDVLVCGLKTYIHRYTYAVQVWSVCHFVCKPSDAEGSSVLLFDRQTRHDRKRRTEWVAMLLTMRSRSGTLSISNLAVAFKLWFKQWCK